jgi:hypothetical protein
MLPPDTLDRLSATTRTTQIIVAALLAGLATFLGVAFILRQGGAFANRGAGGAPILTYVAVAFGAMLLAASWFLPRLIAANMRRGLATRPRQGQEEALLGVYQTTTIVGAALNEGPAFLALIAYMIEGSPVALAVAGLLMGALAARFPSRAGVERWLGDQVEAIERERQFGG